MKSRRDDLKTPGRLSRRRAMLTIAAITAMGGATAEQDPTPGPNWGDWHEAAADMAKIELSSRSALDPFDEVTRSVTWNDRGVRLCYRFTDGRAEEESARQARKLRRRGFEVLGRGVAYGTDGAAWCVFYL